MGKPISFEIQTCYQGPDILDPVQPTEEEIQELIKNWEKENKKIKNPPPMPDFRIPKMMKAPLEVVDLESGRKIKIELQLIIENTEKGKELEEKKRKTCKIDYRQDI